MKRLPLNIMCYFLPVLFVSYSVSIAFFAHIHVVSDVTVVRSHPFKKGTAHKHSTVRLLPAHFLSHLITDGATIAFVLSLFIPSLLWRLRSITQRTHYYSPYHGAVALRAPLAIHFSII